MYVDPKALATTPGSKDLTIVANDGTVQRFVVAVTPKPKPAEKEKS